MPGKAFIHHCVNLPGNSPSDVEENNRRQNAADQKSQLAAMIFCGLQGEIHALRTATTKGRVISTNQADRLLAVGKVASEAPLVGGMIKIITKLGGYANKKWKMRIQKDVVDRLLATENLEAVLEETSYRAADMYEPALSHLPPDDTKALQKTAVFISHVTIGALGEKTKLTFRKAIALGIKATIDIGAEKVTGSEETGEEGLIEKSVGRLEKKLGKGSKKLPGLADQVIGEAKSHLLNKIKEGSEEAVEELVDKAMEKIDELDPPKTPKPTAVTAAGLLSIPSLYTHSRAKTGLGQWSLLRFKQHTKVKTASSENWRYEGMLLRSPLAIETTTQSGTTQTKLYFPKEVNVEKRAGQFKFKYPPLIVRSEDLNHYVAHGQFKEYTAATYPDRKYKDAFDAWKKERKTPLRKVITEDDLKLYANELLRCKQNHTPPPTLNEYVGAVAVFSGVLDRVLDLSGGRFDNVDFSSATLTQKVRLEDTSWTGARMIGITLKGEKSASLNAKNIDLSKSYMPYSTIDHVDMDHANVLLTTLCNSTISNSNLQNIKGDATTNWGGVDIDSNTLMGDTSREEYKKQYNAFATQRMDHVESQLNELYKKVNEETNRTETQRTQLLNLDNKISELRQAQQKAQKKQKEQLKKELHRFKATFVKRYNTLEHSFLETEKQMETFVKRFEENEQRIRKHSTAIQELKARIPSRKDRKVSTSDSTYLCDLSNNPESYFFTGYGEEMKKLEEDFTSGKKQLAVVGRRGIGKTGIATRFCEVHKDEYTFVRWFKADNVAELSTQMREMYVDIKLATTADKSPTTYTAIQKAKLRKAYEVEARNKLNPDIVSGIYTMLEEEKVLFVFDNTKYPIVSPYLKGAKDEHYSLFTSYVERGWRDIPTVPVSKWKQEDARDYICQRLMQGNKHNYPSKENINTKEVDNLIEKLEIPYFIKHALDYINHHERSLKSYLSDYDTSKQKIAFLDIKDSEQEELSDEERNTYQSNVLATWQIARTTLEKKQSDSNLSQEERDNHKNALDILNVFGYLDSTEIPIELFSGLFSELPPAERAPKRDSALTILVDQGRLITRGAGETVKVHELQQEAIRKGLQAQDTETGSSYWPFGKNKYEKQHEAINNTLRLINNFSSRGSAIAEAFSDISDSKRIEMFYPLLSKALYYAGEVGLLSKEVIDSQQKILVYDVVKFRETTSRMKIAHQAARQIWGTFYDKGIIEGIGYLGRNIRNANQIRIFQNTMDNFCKGHYQKAEEWRKTFDISNDAIPHEFVVLYNHLEGFIHLRLSHYDKAENVFRRDLREFFIEGNKEKFNNEIAYGRLKVMQYAAIAVIRLMKGDLDKALEVYQEGSDIYSSLDFNIPNLAKGTMLRTFAEIHHRRGNTLSAKKIIDESVREHHGYLGERKSFDLAMSLQTQGIIRLAAGDLDGAKRSCRKSFNAIEESLGTTDNPYYIDTTTLRSAILIEERQFEDAREQLDENLERGKALYGTVNHRSLIPVLYQLGDTYRLQEQYDTAETYYQQALGVIKELGLNERKHYYAAEINLRYGALYEDQISLGRPGDEKQPYFQESVKSYANAIRIIKTASPSEKHHRVSTEAQKRLGQLYYTFGNTTKAIGHLEPAVMAIKIRPENHGYTKEEVTNLTQKLLACKAAIHSEKITSTAHSKQVFIGHINLGKLLLAQAIADQSPNEEFSSAVLHHHQQAEKISQYDDSGQLPLLKMMLTLANAVKENDPRERNNLYFDIYTHRNPKAEEDPMLVARAKIAARAGLGITPAEETEESWKEVLEGAEKRPYEEYVFLKLCGTIVRDLHEQDKRERRKRQLQQGRRSPSPTREMLTEPTLPRPRTSSYREAIEEQRQTATQESEEPALPTRRIPRTSSYSDAIEKQLQTATQEDDEPAAPKRIPRTRSYSGAMNK